MKSLTPDELAELVADRSMGRARFVVGVAGPPGAGKSTVSDELVARLDAGAAVVPLDGFHRRHDELVAAGLVDRKGAPETFDAASFVELVRSLRSADRTVTAPAYDRSIEDVVPAAIRILPQHRIVVVEGNYLLLRDGPWRDVRGLLDLAVYVDVDDALRIERLVARHIEFGKSADHAARFVDHSDEVNARLVAGSRRYADVAVTAG